MIINKIVKNQLCVGCGLCSSVLGEKQCEMTLSDRGFYLPKMKENADDSIVKKVCPGIRVHAEGNIGIWGNVLDVCEGWSADAEIRHKAASGGIVTSLAIYLIESKKVDAVLQVGVRDDSYLYNELKFSRNREDVIQNAQSRYAPALTLVNIKQILDNTSDIYAFIGKPCDIVGIKNLINLFPHYKDRFRLFISIFCAGMPSYNATERTWRLSGKEETPIVLKYRGDGWPGNFKAKWNDGSEYQLSYNESWGKMLGRDLGFRCKICPDGIGLLADIAVGDSWSTKDGYPDFTEQDGRSFVLIRTNRGREMIMAAEREGYVIKRQLEICKIKEMQPYQFQRRQMVGWRILPVQLLSFGILKFKGLGCTQQLLTSNYKDGVKNMKGTISRILKNKKAKA